MNNDFALGDVALFIDWENFKISLAGGHRLPNVSALKEEVSNHGRVVVAKAYADWVTRAPELRGASQFLNDPPALYASGIEPVYVPTRLPLVNAQANTYRTQRVKNSVDVKMTADCIECAHSYPNVNTFVLVSGDSDFIHVINALRTMGKKVIIIGISWTTSRRLSDLVDGLIFYDIDVDQGSNPAPINPVNNTRIGNNYTRQEIPAILTAIEDIVSKEREAGRMPLLTSVKQRLIRQFPGLDERRLGFTGFKKLVLKATEQGKIRLVTVGMADWVILADEPDPEEITSEDPESDQNDSPNNENVVEDAVDEDAVDEDAVDEDVIEDINIEVNDGRENYAQALVELLNNLEKTKSNKDSNDELRIKQLIVMADYLAGTTDGQNIPANVLGDEIAKNIKNALDADVSEITDVWGKVFSKTYVNKLIKTLSDEKIFNKKWSFVSEEGYEKSRRKRTLVLNAENPIVSHSLSDHWGSNASEHSSDSQPIDGSIVDNGSGLAGKVMKLFSR
jgi:uncharacterized LabA/DUF88 family protein